MIAAATVIALAGPAAADGGFVARPLGTHVTPWAPTGQVVEPGRIRLEYDLPMAVTAAAGVGGLELRATMGAPQMPVQLYGADLAVRGNLVRSGGLRVTVGAGAVAGWLDGTRWRAATGELTVGWIGRRGHIALSRRRVLTGAATLDLGTATASFALGAVHAVVALGRVGIAAPTTCVAPRGTATTATTTATTTSSTTTTCHPPPDVARAAAVGLQFTAGRVTGTVGLAAVDYADYPRVPLPYLIMSVPLEL